MSSDINKGGRVEPTHLTNIDSDTTPLLGENYYENSPPEKKIQRIKNRLGSIKSFFVRHFKFEGYTLMEGSHKPLGNKLASILKHSGNKFAGILKHSGDKLADMLRSIKNFSVNLFRFKNKPPINSILISVSHDWAPPIDSPGVKQLDNHKHLGNKLTSMLGSIKNFSASHFKVKKVVPTKQGNIQDYIINIDGRKYIMCAGNRLVDISDGLNNARDCIINIKGRKYIACADNTLVDVSDWLEELNVAQTKVTQTEVTKTAQPPILRY